MEHEFNEWKARAEAAEEERDMLLEAVRATEWGAGPNKDRCPVCLGFPTVGHNSRCTVGKALAMAAGGAL